MTNKSPFFVIDEFLSPHHCDVIVDYMDFNVPDADKDGFEIKTTKSSERAEAMIYERLLLLLPEVMQYYNIIYKGTESMEFEWFPQGCKGDFLCGNSKFLRGKWLRTLSRDVTGVVFLSDFQDKIPFERDYDVYGGKLEFPQHNFGFNPQRGTLVLFPADPHFINITTPIFAGDLFQVRFHLAADRPYLYNPKGFPGNYQTWFSTQTSK